VERKQAGKVEGKTVDVYVRLGTSAWSRRGEDSRTLSFARPPRRESAPMSGGCQRYPRRILTASDGLGSGRGIECPQLQT